jgi:hypothetical protein
MHPTNARSAFGFLPRLFLPGWLVIIGTLCLSSLRADVVSGTSSGTPLTLNITSSASLTALALPVSATTSALVAVPLAPSSGSAPGAYSTTGGPLNYNSPDASIGLNASTGALDVNTGVNTLSIGASVLTDAASSTVDGGSGSQTTSASAGLTGLSLNVGVISATIDPLVGPTIGLNTSALSITTGVISSFSQVTGAGDGSEMEASFSTSVENFNISLFGVSILSLAPSDLVANLEAGNPVNVVIDLGDAIISLPEGLSDLSVSGLIQITSEGIISEDVLSGSASASALTIGFQNINISAVIGGLTEVQTTVTGVVTAGDTMALQAAPEPSAALLAAGGRVILLYRRRR